jgi:polysaccharide biosynthesis/export protein
MRLHKACPAGWVSGLIAALMASMAAPAAADYLVHRGDVVEIAVSGSPELHRRMMVDDDGKVSFPLVGEVGAAGLSVAQLRSRLRDLLVAKKLFDNPDVTAEIVEYRPVYVTGDVDKPGAYPYRPGMTVRDAVAVAGGYGPRLLRDMLVAAIDARDQYDASSIALVRLDLRIARFQAALAGHTEIDVEHPQTGPVDAAIVTEFAGMEAQQLKADQEDYDKQKAYFERMIKTARDVISALAEEQEHGRLALEQQQKDAARTSELLQKGLVPLTRVEDQQRAIASADWQLLEVKSRAAAARKDLEEATRTLQKLPDQRKIDLMQQLQKATDEQAATRVRAETAGEKLVYLGAAMRQRRQNDGDTRDIAIFRKEPAEHIAAREDTEVIPGDAVEITTRAKFGPLSATPGVAGPPATAAVGSLSR